LQDASLASKVNFYSFDELQGAEMYLGMEERTFSLIHEEMGSHFRIVLQMVL